MRVFENSGPILRYIPRGSGERVELVELVKLAELVNMMMKSSKIPASLMVEACHVFSFAVCALCALCAFCAFLPNNVSQVPTFL